MTQCEHRLRSRWPCRSSCWCFADGGFHGTGFRLHVSRR